MKKKIKRNRPFDKEIDWDNFKKLCQMHCTRKEIANFLEITEKTLTERCKVQFGMLFSEIYDQYTAEGKISIRRKQFEVGMTGNVVMLIWLGKQHLGQRDKKDDGESTITEVKVTMHPDTIPNGNISEVGLQPEAVAS